MEYDVIVVGGSFSGLSSAYFLAKTGLHVVVIDKREICKFTKTTGILEQAIDEDIKVPNRLIEKRIKGLSIYSPKLHKYSFQFKKSKFRQTKTLEFLKWMKQSCSELGVDFIENTFCQRILINDDFVNCEGIKGKVIVFATGVLPKLSFLPKSNFEYYSGLEYLANWKNTDKPSFWQLYFDSKLAPGYFFWIAPVDEYSSHIGILKRMNDRIAPVTSMNKFFLKLHRKPNKIKEIRSGVVPMRGSVDKTYGKRFLIVGDAAGHLGQFFSGGIHYGIRCGRIIGSTLPDVIDDPHEKNLKIYEDTWKKEVGNSLKEERLLRTLFDKFIINNEQLENILANLGSTNNDLVDELLFRFSSMQKLNFKNLLLPYFDEIPKLLKSFI
jgi:digeranylgeranylglycerophospholipid reductase